MNAVVESSEAAIFARALNSINASFSPDAANSILQITFPESDLERMNVLAAKARDGSLDDEESAELENYRHVGRILELLKSKAHLSLKTPRAA